MSAVEVERDEREYRDYLNSVYAEVEICGMMMQQGTILYEMDYTAFREMLNNEPPQWWQCTECGLVHDDKDDAEECWETCCDTVECEECGALIMCGNAIWDAWRITKYENGNIVGYLHFCSEKHLDIYYETKGELE